MITEGKNQKLATDQVESLRTILERKQKRHITSDEAAEVGQSLIDFFELLADKTARAEA